jgi:hypothetical protein
LRLALRLCQGKPPPHDGAGTFHAAAGYLEEDVKLTKKIGGKA